MLVRIPPIHPTRSHPHSLVLLLTPTLQNTNVAAAPVFQPETAQRIFNRVMFNTDVATGNSSSLGYTSTGLASAWIVSEPISYNKTAQCYLWDVLETCTKQEMGVLYSGKAVVKDYVLVGVDNSTTTS
jgi:hypothetical protein